MSKPMTSKKTQTAIIVGIVVLAAAVIVIGIMALISKSKQAAHEKELAAENPVEYNIVLHPSAQSEDELRNELLGTWQMAGNKSYGAAEFTYVPANNGQFKTFTLTNWSIITYDDNSNVLSSASGRYLLASNIYTESIDFATGNMIKVLGKHPKFRIRVDGDKYYQMSASAKGTNKKPLIEEMWRRVDE
jgi:hypothetical protein